VTDDEPELDTDDRLDAIERDVKALQANLEEITAKMDVIIDSREDIKILLTTVLAKVDEANSNVRAFTVSSKPGDQPGGGSAPSSGAIQAQHDASPIPPSAPATPLPKRSASASQAQPKSRPVSPSPTSSTLKASSPAPDDSQ
jgi:hypothetical protein